jgi:hypothetical protein
VLDWPDEVMVPSGRRPDDGVRAGVGTCGSILMISCSVPVASLDGDILAACGIANWYQRWVEALPDVSAEWGS